MTQILQPGCKKTGSIHERVEIKNITKRLTEVKPTQELFDLLTSAVKCSSSDSGGIRLNGFFAGHVERALVP